MAFRSPHRSLKTRVTLVTSLVSLVGIGALAVLIAAWQYGDLRETLGGHQFSTAAVVAAQVGGELEVRFQALQAVAGQVSSGQLSRPRDLQAFLDQKPILSVLFNAGAFFTDAEGTAIASVPASARRVGLNYLFRNHVRRALKEGLPALSDVTIGLALKEPVFSLAVPVFGSGTVPTGCLVGVTDLSQANFLDRIQQNGLGRTGGFLLVDRSQRLIVTATDKTRILEQLPAPGVLPKIDRYLEGGEGWDILVNPRRIEVLVAVKQIPGTDWYLAASSPAAEAFRQIADLRDRILVLAFLLAVVIGLVNWLVLRHQLSPVLATIGTLAGLTKTSRPLAPLEVARQDEIGELIGSFNRLLEEIRRREEEQARYEALVSRTQRLEAIGLLAGGIAHDFNNLLAGIFGNLELALLKDRDGPGSAYLSRALGTLGRARSLTQQFLTFSKGGEPELKAGHLFPFAEETVRFVLSGSPVLCAVDTVPDLRPLRYDRHQLAQVLENLTLNAVQAMPQGGTLTLTARNLDDDDGRKLVRLTVADTGPGLGPEARAHLFEPFYTSKAQGHGLGLTTCFSIVAKHGGTIEAGPGTGGGAAFLLTFPASGGPEAPEEDQPDTGHRGRGAILVMDDEPEVREVFGEWLREFGYTPVLTASADEAEQAFRRDRETGPAIVAAVLDLTVPGGAGGVETLGRLRALDPELPAVVSSGYSDAAVLGDPGAYGFTDSLRKPYLRGDLEAVLGRVLGEGRRPS